MARLTDRLKALEAVKRVKFFMPLIIIVQDELTESQKLEIAEAEKEGQKVVMIMRDDS
jgi:cell division inhibitor SulA